MSILFDYTSNVDGGDFYILPSPIVTIGNEDTSRGIVLALKWFTLGIAVAFFWEKNDEK